MEFGHAIVDKRNKPKATAMTDLLQLINAVHADQTTVIGGPKLHYAMRLCRPITPDEQENLTFVLNTLQRRKPDLFRRVRSTMNAAAVIVNKKR